MSECKPLAEGHGEAQWSLGRGLHSSTSQLNLTYACRTKLVLVMRGVKLS